MIVKLLTEHHFEFLSSKRRLQRLVLVYKCQNSTLLGISCHGLIIYIFSSITLTFACHVIVNDLFKKAQ